MTPRIRDYRSSDAEALSRLYERSVRDLGATRYSAAQIEAWASLTPSAESLRAKMADGRFRLVCETANGEIVGFLDAEPDGHIDLLYAAPEVSGTGVAKLLYEAAEARLAEAGCDRVFAEASELARSFFERRGFSTVERRDFEVAGVAIHNFAVEKRLP